jgi:hypothetical protein
VYRVNRAAAAVEVFHGLSDDGLWGLLGADSSPPPVVFLHRPYTQLQVQWQERSCSCIRGSCIFVSSHVNAVCGQGMSVCVCQACDSSVPRVVYLQRQYTQLQVLHVSATP